MLNIRHTKMRPLLDRNAICNELKNIFSSPVKIIADYDTIPELKSKISFPELGRREAPEFYCYRLGKSTIQKISYNLPKQWTVTPELSVYELNDVIVFKGLVFTKRGELLADSIRVRNCDNIPEWGESNDNGMTDTYAAIAVRHNVSHIQKYDCPVINFCSQSEYGHYLLEVLTNLWITDYGFTPSALLLSPQSGQAAFTGIPFVPEYLPAMVKPFNFTEKNFLIAPVGIFKKFILPTRAYMYPYYLHDAAKLAYDKISTYYSDTVSCTKLIYVSRKNIVSRKLLNEEECETLFKEYGFTVITPESLTFSEQVNIFANATHIAGPVGSALHNIVFSKYPRSVKLFLIAPQERGARSVPPVILERWYNREPCAVFGEYIHTKGSIASLNDPWTVSLKDLETGLNQWLTNDYRNTA